MLGYNGPHVVRPMDSDPARFGYHSSGRTMNQTCRQVQTRPNGDSLVELRDLPVPRGAPERSESVTVSNNKQMMTIMAPTCHGQQPPYREGRLRGSAGSSAGQAETRQSGWQPAALQDLLGPARMVRRRRSAGCDPCTPQIRLYIIYCMCLSLSVQTLPHYTSAKWLNVFSVCPYALVARSWLGTS